MPKIATKMAKVCRDRNPFAHFANFIKLTSVVVSHKLLGEAVLRPCPLACAALLGVIAISAHRSLVTPLTLDMIRDTCRIHTAGTRNTVTTVSFYEHVAIVLSLLFRLKKYIG